MRILKLRFKNLNSLYGTWVIDFTNPEYSSNGIFAIVGSTGAGKSTVLDAICLALYGRTPRLKSISKSSNEIMSRQTGECFAEVTFETLSGKYLCHWSQRRAQKKPNGKLQESKHEISNANSKEIIESKKRNVANAIEQKTGMDFDRFTRSMLLAQGGFAAFLQAQADERAPILEQITGTEIYSDISKKVHERQRTESNNIDLLNAKSSGIVLMTEDEENQLILQFVNIQKEEGMISNANTKTAELILWKQGIESLSKEIELIDKEYAELIVYEDEFLKNKSRLRIAQNAAEIESDYATLKEVRKQQIGDTKNKKELSNQLLALNESLKEINKELDDAKNKTSKQEKALELLLILIKETREIDSSVENNKNVLSELMTEYEKNEEKLLNYKTEEKGIKEKVTSLRTQTLEIDIYFNENSADEELIVELTGIRERIKNITNDFKMLNTMKSKIEFEENKYSDAEKKYVDQIGLHTKEKEKYNDIKLVIESTQTEINEILDSKLLREYRSDHMHLNQQKGLIQKIYTYEEERKKLQDSNPCPLCGSIQHPFAEGNIPEITLVDEEIKRIEGIIESVEKLDKKLKKQETRGKELFVSLNEAKNKIDILCQNKITIKSTIENIEKDFNEKKEVLENQKVTLLSKLKPFVTNEKDDFKTILIDLEERSENWKTKVKVKKEQDNICIDLTSKQKQNKALIENYETVIKDKKVKCKKYQIELNGLKAKREEIFGLKNTDVEEKKQKTILENYQAYENRKESDSEKTKTSITMLGKQLNTLNEKIIDRAKKLDDMEINFIDRLKISNFEGESLFLLALMSSEDKRVLISKKENYEHKLNSIGARKKDRTSIYNNEVEKNLTEKALAFLIEELENSKKALSELGANKGALQEKLDKNNEEKNNNELNQKAIMNAQKEFEKWSSLHSLIGSADGKKFRNFAQGITFELLISHANIQLTKMTDRYLLIRDKEQPLELDVVDNYQAGEIRSTKNLSGGESFIVSLSLALGLSKMSSKKVKVDSLFLDEGFGTLDDEALETALETLACLQQDGKLIGIISHVPALKERISTQINVQKISGGKSILNGPGISKK
ncbi:MAG: AAA family ATPase [Caldisericia bacterium]|nr:AAA family ATPase [Caldisericia bacterium]